MPATAGRVRMPANNRVHSSAALQTHGIWQSAIGYDPYAPNKSDSKQSAGAEASNSAEPETENAYASFQGLLALARITGSNVDEARGACRKCCRVGHLTFQCRNFLSLKGFDDKEKDADAALQSVASVLDKSKATADDDSSEESSELDDESESSDSDVDSEIERIIAARYGKKSGGNVKSLASKKGASKNDGLDSGDGRKRGGSKRGRSGKMVDDDSDDERHGYSDDEDAGHRVSRKSRKEKKRSHWDSDDEDERDGKRRRHGYSDDEVAGHRHSRKSRKDRRSHGDSDDEDGGRHHYRKSRKEKKRGAVSPVNY